MERQQELKVLLKRWEAEFLRERRRKPSQADIEEAPPETRRLYEEYRRLKKSGKTSEFSGKTSEFSGQSGSQEIPKVEQVEDSGFWGSHLNRAPKIPGKSRSGKPRPGISVEFYGMKLKSKLGTIGKEPPLTPRRTPNPGRIPKIPQSQKVLEHRAEASPAEASQNEEKSENSRKIPKIPQSQKIPEHRGEASPAEASQNEEKSENSRKIPKIPQSQKIPEHRGEASSAETSQNEEKSENSRRFPKIPQSQKIPEHRGEASPAELPQNEEKSENPRRFPKIPQSQKIPEHRAEASPAELPQNEEKSENPENSKEFQDLIVPPSIPGLEPLTFPMGINPKFSPIPEKFQRLKEKVAQTLGSLDPGWIQRCQEKAGIAAGFGNSVRKRPREGGGAAEAPAQLRKRLRREPGIVGMGKFQEEREREGERPRFPNEAEEERSGKIPQKEEKAKAARKTLAPPGNFVRLNLKRKTYSRGFQRGKFLRKQVWKQKWRKKFGAGGDCCFRCGGKGHWAAQCTGKNLGSFPEQTPEEEEALPTLDEAAQRSSTVFIPDFPDAGSNMENSQDFLHPEFPPPPVAPLYPPNPDGTIPDPPAEVLEALRILGFDSFRPGQAQAIMRVLSGISTLVLLPTGTGKSLCYQLPAFLYHRNCGSISLVISPLVSLMDDQVSNLPSSLKAVCIHSNLTQSQREAAMKKVRSGQAQILLLSPESLVASGSFSRFFRNFPPIAFACLDEAHCISQWSHNFRPAYLRVCKVLRERLGVRCFLGLTATATVATAQDISKHLGIPLENGAQPGSGEIPKNLQLSVSMEHNKDQALLELLQRWNLGNFGNCGNFGNSVIVYCTRREESERLAALIQAEFPEFPENSREKHGKGKRRELRVSAAYHAGLAPRDRSRIQRDFMENRIRVLCATSALGMGLHKGDVGAIVHFGVPGSLERFLQEIGRAGRGGAGARGHLLMDTRGEDFWELRRHIHENSVDFLTVKTLIQRVFAPCKCLENDGKIQEKSKEFPKFPKNSRICRGHERSIPIQEFVESLDLREEGIETLLCLLELQPQKFLENLPRVHSRCRIRVFGNSPEPLREAALGCPPLGFLLAQNSSGISGVSGILEFDAVALSDSMGWEFQRVQESLRRIPWEAKKGRRIQVEFQELSFHFRAFGDLNSQELDSSWEFLNSQILKWEKSELRRLQSCFQTFQSVAFPGFTPEPPEQEQLEKNSQLREKIREYFQKIPTESEEEEEEKNPGMDPEQEQEIRAQIREFLAANPEQEFSGRAVARIFHGIGSPRFPAQVFGRDRRFWRRLLALPFRSLARLAAQEILAAR